MSRRLVAVNLLLLVVVVVSGYWIAREMTMPRHVPRASAPRPAPQGAPGGTAEAAEKTPPAEPRPLYNVIAAKNLFSATRTESTAAAGAATPPPKLYLHGVVVDEKKSRAFIEDVIARSTFGYAVGDAVGGGRLEAVKADRVVISRPEGSLEVMLRDPSKPQPAPPAAPGTATTPGAPTPPAAGTVRPGLPRAPVPPAAAAGIQGIQPTAPGAAVPPGVRLLRPDLIRPPVGPVPPATAPDK